MGTIALLMTLDTKGHQAAYLKQALERMGHRVLTVDIGARGRPQAVAPDIGREEVLKRGGLSPELLAGARNRGEAMSLMARAARATLEQLHRTGSIDGAMGVGGSAALVAAVAMQGLPFGFPKMVVSPLASGPRPFGPFVGAADITLMHSVVDLLGLSALERSVLDRAAAAMAGMVAARAGSAPAGAEGWLGPSPGGGDGRPTIGATMLGVTTPGVTQAREILEAAGLELTAFHASGTGGTALEQLVGLRVFAGVLDYTTSELAGELYGGLHRAQVLRLKAASELGVPQVVLPGGVDFLVFGPADTVPPHLSTRARYMHDPQFTLVRTSASEMAEVGRLMARRLSAARGPAGVVWPLLGLSEPGREGEPLHDPAADRAGLDALRAHLAPHVRLVVVDAHINDRSCAQAAAEMLLEMLKREAEREVRRGYADSEV